MSDLAHEGLVTGKTLHVLFRGTTDIAVDLAAGIETKTTLYSATEAEIAAKSVPAGYYAPVIYHGLASAHAVTDEAEGVFDEFYWTGALIQNLLTKIDASLKPIAITVNP